MQSRLRRIRPEEWMWLRAPRHARSEAGGSQAEQGEHENVSNLTLLSCCCRTGIRGAGRGIRCRLIHMPIGSPLHERTLALCESLNYREWSGYYAVSAYEGHHEHEYNAIRNASALSDVSPLFNYMITGRDAPRLVDRIITRDVSKMSIGQVFYTPWCDERGRVIDDGTVSRLEEHRFRW